MLDKRIILDLSNNFKRGFFLYTFAWKSLRNYFKLGSQILHYKFISRKLIIQTHCTNSIWLTCAFKVFVVYTDGHSELGIGLSTARSTLVAESGLDLVQNHHRTLLNCGQLSCQLHIRQASGVLRLCLWQRYCCNWNTDEMKLLKIDNQLLLRSLKFKLICGSIEFNLKKRQNSLMLIKNNWTQ